MKYILYIVLGIVLFVIGSKLISKFLFLGLLCLIGYMIFKAYRKNAEINAEVVYKLEPKDENE